MSHGDTPQENPPSVDELALFIESVVEEGDGRSSSVDLAASIDEECRSRGSAILRMVQSAVESVKSGDLLKKKKMEIPFHELIATGSKDVPEITMEDLIVSTMGFRLAEASSDGGQRRNSEDVATTYALLRRWLERRDNAVRYARGLIADDSADAFFWPSILKAISLYREMKAAGGYPLVDADIDALVATGDPELTYMPKSALVAATMFHRSQYHRSTGRVLVTDEEQVRRCLLKCEKFLMWFEGAKELAKANKSK